MVYSLYELDRALADKFAANKVLARISCGAVAGITAKSFMAPFELLKMCFQVSSEAFNYTSLFSKFKDILKKDGVFALWRGHSANILRVAPYAAMHYTIHDLTEFYLTRVENNYYNLGQRPSSSSGASTTSGGYRQAAAEPAKSKSHWVQFLSGAAGGAGATLCTYPLDVLRARVATMQVTNSKNSWRVAAGAKGFFHGFVPTLLGIIPYSGTAWTVKAYLQHAVPLFTGHSLTLMQMFAINSIAGLTGQFITYPLDVVRRRMQVASVKGLVDGQVPPHRAMRVVFQELLATEGVRGMFKGFSLNILKGPITLSISLTSYDLLKKHYGID